MHKYALVLSGILLTACSPAPSGVDRYQTMLEGTPVEITIGESTATMQIMPGGDAQLYRASVLGEIEIGQRARCSSVTRRDTNAETMMISYDITGCLG